MVKSSVKSQGAMMHGILMICAWCWLVPAGVLSAVFKKSLGPAWIHVHQPIQVKN